MNKAKRSQIAAALYGLRLLLLFLLYLATARLGLSLNAVSGFATLIWIPSGVALSTLYLFGDSLFPAVFVGAFVVNVLSGAPPLIALAIGIGNTLEAVVGSYLLRRMRFRVMLDTVSQVVKLIVITPISAALSATIGVLSLSFGGAILQMRVLPTWQAWWVGDMVSILILSPFIFVWTRKPNESFQPKRIVEIALLSISAIFIGVIAFQGIFGVSTRTMPLTYLVFLPLLWAALRFDQKGATMVVVILSICAVSETILGLSPFVSGSLSDRLLYLQSFMAIISITSLILAALEAERRELEQRKDEFISFASHELKNPLTSLKAYTQLTHSHLRQKQTKKAERLLEKGEAQADKLERLINDLLDLSKIQAGKLELHKEQFPFADVVIETVDAMQTITSTHTISLKKPLKEHSFRIIGDRDRLSQVLINLLTNAVKYSPKKKSIVVAAVKKQNEVVVSVKDYGIGMSGQEQENLFQRYYRAQHPKERSVPGLGIGLYIASEIIQLHKGKIWVHSLSGKGSTFYFSLPLAE